MGHLGPSWAVWILPGPIDTFLDYLRLLGPSWSFQGPPGPSWASLSLLGPSWAFLGIPGLSWAVLGLPGSGQDAIPRFDLPPHIIFGRASALQDS